MLNDLCRAMRTLLKSPGFTAVSVLSLTLGIGVSTAVFSLVNAILLRSLPVPNPHELRLLEWSTNELPAINSIQGGVDSLGGGLMSGNSFSYPTFRALRDQCAREAEIFAWCKLPNVTIRARREAFAAQGLIVSGNFFQALGVRPEMGRLIAPDDDRADAPPAIVLSHGLWQKQFDRDAVGQSLMLDGHAFTVVGVLPREFPGVQPGDDAEFYVPTSAQPQLHVETPLASDRHWWLSVMARLAPSTSDAQLQSAMNLSFSRGIGKEHATVVISDGRAGPDLDRNHYRQPLLLLLGIMGIVLLATCANLAGLSVARGAARMHDLAVRAAIGAGRWRLIRESLGENLLLAAIGAVFGIAVAMWGKTAISRLLSGSADGLHYDTSLDLTVLGFVLGATLLTAFLSGLLPALRAARVDPVDGLRVRSSMPLAQLRGVKALVAAQIGLALVLLTGAGLFVQTLRNLVKINPGFAAENLLVFRLDPFAAGYKEAALAQFYDRAQNSLTAIPGVRSASAMAFPLLSGAMSKIGFTIPGHPKSNDMVAMQFVDESFFTTMEIPILAGRGFSKTDAPKSPRVVVVNEAFVRRYLPGEDPIGWRLSLGADCAIVGVARDAKYENIKTEAPPTVYRSLRQIPMDSAYFAVRTTLPPQAVAAAARAAIAGIDPNIPLASVTTQIEIRDQRIGQERMFATLCAVLGGLAVLLACIGLYGLMAYKVARRTSEIGVRMALGATRSQIATPILRDAIVMTLAGIASAIPVTIALTRIIRSNLYGIEPNNPATLVGAAGLLMLVAILAAWIPARRAARVDPMVALRSE